MTKTVLTALNRREADAKPQPHLIGRVTSRPQDQHVCACAGALVVGNPSTNLLSRMQDWDYRLGINDIKRIPPR
jgi:hypothetical protein